MIIAITGTPGTGKTSISKKLLKKGYEVIDLNKEALEKTTETGYAHYYSTSRKKIWLKGETSGNRQLVKEILVDCDGDALLYMVKQQGTGAACHEGYRSCFYRQLKGCELKVVKQRIFDPKDVYL